MDQRTIQILFALLRSAIRGTKLTQSERESYCADMLPDLLKFSARHDVIHLLVLGLKQNELISGENAELEKCILKAVYRYERLHYEYDKLCDALEKAQIPFLPLKGSVIRNYYPQAWMRTSCDIDILVHREDLDAAITYLSDNLKYSEKERTPHDVSLFSPLGIHVELHFDLVEEGRANNAIDILQRTWDNVLLHEDKRYWYEMTDAFFCFYHIAHMAKHFENGGCGIRPFLDLWILDNLENVDKSLRDDLLVQGGLFQFAEISRKLSRAWFDDGETDDLLLQLQDFILHGGVYGSAENRVALQQTKKGGRFGYLLSRIFIPFAKLKRYYPILEKYPWLTPIMQIRRWFMLTRPSVMKMAKREIAVNGNLDKGKACEMSSFLENMGL